MLLGIFAMSVEYSMLTLQPASKTIFKFKSKTYVRYPTAPDFVSCEHQRCRPASCSPTTNAQI